MALQIDNPKLTFSVQTITINKKTYKVYLRYNSRFDYWVLSLQDSKGDYVISGEKILPLKDLITRYNKVPVLGGYLFIDSSNLDEITYNDLGLQGSHVITYVSLAEALEYV